MAAGKEIRGKIKSVENTKKITKAMEMVAASKMRKAQERMRAARPYSEKIRNIAANLGHANPEYVHPFMKVNDAKVVSHVTGLGDKPHLDKLIGPVKVLLDAYAEGKINAVYLSYTKFINTMKQESVVERLLPLSSEQMQAEKTEHGWDYIYEPDAQTVIDDLLVRYVESLIYQAVAENMASEQSARMVAMKAATDNAGSVIGELKLVYNKTRQAAITKELSEIVAGAAAV